MRITRHVIAAVISLLAPVKLFSDSLFDFRGAADDSAVMAVLRNLAERAAYLVHDEEVAAFILQEPGGRVSCLLWPTSANARSAHFSGSIPKGTVAIAHTHPLQAPLPSRGDVAQAKRIGLPIYVVSRWDLYVIDPSSGERIQLIGKKNWTVARPSGR